jgi:lipopolysaccharide/colanic/teichoic acid biosynthesis glycosyltransferase
VIALLNPVLNPGPLLFAQERLGRDGRPFRMLKFRTMRPAGADARRPGGAVEADRITPLGAVLRRTRIDELPQFANILAGEMSLVGPRPDWLDEARLYEATVPGYAERHRVRPGISGLAQVETGYAEGQEMTREKVRHDLRYIRDASWRQEMRILARTVRVVLTGFGAK